MQNALLDLLGTTDLNSPMSSVPAASLSASTPPATNSNDLLDLLGGLDLSSPTPVPSLAQQSPSQLFSPTNASNFLVDGLLNSAASIPQNGLFLN